METLVKEFKSLGTYLACAALAAIVFLVMSLGATTAAAAPYKVERRDMKLASQKLIEHLDLSGPVATDENRVVDNQSGSASDSTTVTSFAAQPDVCRVLTVTAGGTAADIATGNITVSGFNALGESISENFATTANTAETITGTKAFCTVSSVVIPQQDGADARFSLGINDSLGAHRCMENAGGLLHASFGGVKEGTAPTVFTDADEVEKNLFDLNSALDGSDVDVFFIQNYACQ